MYVLPKFSLHTTESIKFAAMFICRVQTFVQSIASRLIGNQLHTLNCGLLWLFTIVVTSCVTLTCYYTCM